MASTRPTTYSQVTVSMQSLFLMNPDATYGPSDLQRKLSVSNSSARDAVNRLVAAGCIVYSKLSTPTRPRLVLAENPVLWTETRGRYERKHTITKFNKVIHILSGCDVWPRGEHVSLPTLCLRSVFDVGEFGARFIYRPDRRKLLEEEQAAESASPAEDWGPNVDTLSPPKFLLLASA